MSEPELIVILGAGINGLTCALEIQRRNPTWQVDLIAQVLPGDPPPFAWSTGYSYFNRFEHTEYFSAETIEEGKVLALPNFQVLQPDQLVEGAKHGLTFTSVSVMPDQVINRLLSEFGSCGGRIFRGTVRHLNEIIEAPSAIVVCVGIGARTIGGIEDTSLRPMRIQVLKLRAPWMTVGKAFYGEDNVPTFFAIPLGSGDVLVGSKPDYDDWFAKPRPQTTIVLLNQARKFCPELIPTNAGPDYDLSSLLVWEGCDIFGMRNGGPRLEVKLAPSTVISEGVHIIYNYGYGPSELQVFQGAAEAVANLLGAAIEQGKNSDMSDDQLVSALQSPDIDDDGQMADGEILSVPANNITDGGS
ncbi:hypothetical protein EST38_g7395 [Candolleomyces aberdarensis]|uniref:FAD dependent oxidoreductase domain-containing protein n=1 Tax=Candolleomyces aberdarensis TaxID=2316362 RepID=A0A4Q2DF84_9AGAR|nr:hypothetical protein EST38_g7395 [Candolleomyces aberdarensis]